MVLNSSTKHPFQSNPIIDVWRIYREKGFVLGLIGKDALLMSYGRFKMPFCPLSLLNRTPIGARSYANWGTIGTQLAPNFRFSMVLNSSTKHPFQSNPIIDVWRIYREKGFVWGLIGKDALLASYGRLKMPFCPLSLPNRTPIGARSYYDWGMIGVRLAPNWHQIGHLSRLTGSIGAGP